MTAKNDKEKKFKEILEENDVCIHRICNYYAPTSGDKEDLYQEILINIWKSLDRFRGDSKVSTWVYRIAVNTSLSFSGKAFKNSKIFLDGDGVNLNFFAEGNSAEEKQLLDKNLDLLSMELNMLSVIDKALISLMLEGLSMKEIADIIGITEPNVKIKIHRIKTELKNKIKI